MTLLAIDRLSLAIGGKLILRSVSLTVAPGEILGLVGESGSGKSMTLNAIMRLGPPGTRTEGAIRFEGADLLAGPERAMESVRGRKIGMVFQEPMTALNPVQTIGRQVAECFRLHLGFGAREALAEAAERLRRAGLPPEIVPLDRYPHQLSGGQRQRVVVAIAAALGPKLILADEPTTALDATARGGIIDLLAGLARREGAGLVFVTHDLASIAGIADRIAFMKDGEVVEEGSAPSIFRSLRHPYAQSLLAASALPPIAPDEAAGGTEPIVEAVDVSVVYGGGVRAVDGVSLTLMSGESLAIVGESGSGKSTLARSVLGLEPLAAGTVRIAGTDIHRASGGALRAARAAIQAVFQDPYGSLNPRHRIERIVAEPLHLLGRIASAERRARIARALADVGLPPDGARRYPHEFSGGQRQRIAIARALISEPKVIVLDEAVSALDVTTRAQIVALLRELSRRRGLAYLFITHDLDAARAVANRVVVMRRGRVVEEGRTAAVLAQPHDPYTKELIAAAPDLETVLAAREAEARTR
ncbi:MAG: ABC transporter ATP-binding protein [Alphaproteobacteria bacterium]|nr:ABC transporter ATP-binding protein [Alphaproteobacteria bacterium]